MACIALCMFGLSLATGAAARVSLVTPRTSGALTAGAFSGGALVQQLPPSAARAQGGVPMRIEWGEGAACLAAAAAGAPCELRAFSGNASFAWDGVIGNSGPQVGPYIWRGMDMLQDMFRTESAVELVQQYHGGLSATQKQDVLERTQLPLMEGKQEVLLVQLQSGGTGLNLQHFDQVIFTGPWWTKALMDQAVGRAVRIGQKKVVKIYQLQLRTEEGFNIDEFMMDKVFQKKELGDMFESWSVHLKHGSPEIVSTP
jgi:hypothetical protein